MQWTLTVRPANARDVDAVDALLARSYPRLLKPDYPPSVMVTALPIISRAQPELVVCGTYYVAEDLDWNLLGAGGWTPRPGSRIADVRHLVTDDRATRRGVARSIMEQVFSDARKTGVRTLDCKATRTAVPFYQAMGFTTLGPIEVGLRPGISFPAIQMQRAL
ncbi:MAG: GNAT family N-acetyltransferase [Pseudomonadota bacterium]